MCIDVSSHVHLYWSNAAIRIKVSVEDFALTRANRRKISTGCQRPVDPYKKGAVVSWVGVIGETTKIRDPLISSEKTRDITIQRWRDNEGESVKSVTWNRLSCVRARMFMQRRS